MNTRKQALLKIQMLDFAMIDLGLYLDVYPDNKNALEYFSQLQELRESAVCEYESRYGPLTIYGLNDKNYNTYINGPWPWEREI